MRLTTLLLAAALLTAQKKPVTLDDVGPSRPPGGGSIPNWAPDGKRFLYQQGKKLLQYDAATGDRRDIITLDPLEEKARKPPTPEKFEWRNRRVREQRIQWSSTGRELLLSVDGDLFWHTIESGQTQQLTATREVEADPRLSPDGRRASYRLDADLYTLEIATRKLTRLTSDGSATTRNAELDWVYPEELDLGRAHWWAPDSRHIAYLQFDVSPIEVHPQVDLLRAVYEPQRYPKAGTPNALVRLGVVPAAGKKTRWMNLGSTRDTLLARVEWLPDSRALAVIRLNRVQDRLELLLVDIATGEPRVILEEKDPYWINVQDDLRFLPRTGRFLWSSERGGFRHLYLHSLDGRQQKQLTQGDWAVSDVSAIDESAEVVFFTGTREGPLERHLYCTGFDGGTPRKLTARAGTHSISMSPTADYWLDTFSSLTEPSRTTVHARDGGELRSYREPDRRAEEQYDLQPTQIVEIKTPDGALLYARLIKPAGFDPARKYPAVVFVYGGPGAQSIRNAWSGVTWEQALAHRGYVIWQLDNRGSGGRGHQWEAALYRRFGARELEDQKRGVEHLVSLGFVDDKRIGIYGWSYGGFMTLYSLTNAPDLFRCGIAGAPVTDWRFYDTIYTERYLGLPAQNEEGYKASSPVNYAQNLKAAVMLAHNAEDDNVLVQNTVKMMDALEKAGKPFDLLLYPQKSHGVTGSARRHMLRAMTDFLDRHLAPARGQRHVSP